MVNDDGDNVKVEIWMWKKYIEKWIKINCIVNLICFLKLVIFIKLSFYLLVNYMVNIMFIVYCERIFFIL